MSNKKQTAVEWFFSELERMQYFIGNDMLQAYNQAKEMERQQIEQAATWGSLFETGKQYYKETYEASN
tara:strand:- start:119 stop:322 length:204 start_codon:yes stop_codon:yes gene_type:complete